VLENFSSKRSAKKRFDDGIRHINEVAHAASQTPSYTKFDFKHMLPFYGKVDFRLNPIQPKQGFLTSIGTDQFGRPVQVFDFVASAFDHLKNHIQRGIFYNKLSQNSIFSRIAPTTALVNLDSSYREYMENIFNSFYESYVLIGNNQDKILDFSSFLSLFLDFYEMVMSSSNTPITKSGYYLYTQTPLFHTGLAIKINFADVNDIQDDSGYGYFCSSARKSGFLVDTNDPTTIIANINNGGQKMVPPFKVQPQFGEKQVITGMREHLERFSLTAENVFNKRYFSIIYDEGYLPLTDFNLLKTYFLQFYRNMVDETPAVSISKACNVGGKIRTNHNVIYRKVYLNDVPNGYPSSFSRDYPDPYWLEMYLYIKLLETKKDINQEETLKKALYFYRTSGLKAALFFINLSTKIVPSVTDDYYLSRI